MSIGKGEQDVKEKEAEMLTLNHQAKNLSPR